MMKNLLGHAIRSERMKEMRIYVSSFYPSTNSDNWRYLVASVPAHLDRRLCKEGHSDADSQSASPNAF